MGHLLSRVVVLHEDGRLRAIHAVLLLPNSRVGTGYTHALVNGEMQAADCDEQRRKTFVVHFPSLL